MAGDAKLAGDLRLTKADANSSAARSRRAWKRSRSCCAAGRRGVVGMGHPAPAKPSASPDPTPVRPTPKTLLDAAIAQPGVEHARHLLGVVDDLGHGLGPSGAVVTGERLDRAGRVRSGVRVWRLHTPGSSRWTAPACRAWKQPAKTRGGLRRRSWHRGSIGPRLRADRRQEEGTKQNEKQNDRSSRPADWSWIRGDWLRIGAKESRRPMPGSTRGEE